MNDTGGTGEADGMDRAVSDALRIGLMAAARAGEEFARRYAQQQRGIQEADNQHARDLQKRFDASRAAARAQLAPVVRADWWDAAGPQMVAQVNETATAWRGLDPEAAVRAEQIREQIRQRWGIDLPDSASAGGVVAARIEEVAAGAVLAGAGSAGAENTSAGEPAQHSEARWRRLAQALAGHPDREAVAARLLAEKHQGTPPGASVESRPRGRGPARNAPAPARVQGMERGRTAR